MNRDFLIRPLLAAGMAVLLGGCLLGRPADPTTVLAPEIRLEPAADWPVLEASLTIHRPTADQSRDSARILVREGARLQAYPGTVWMDNTPELLQLTLFRAFEDSGRVAGGVRRPGEGRSPFGLLTDIRRFEAVSTASGLAVELAVGARLVEGASSRFLASRTFQARVEAAGDDPGTLAGAFEEALGELTRALVGWTLEHAAGAAGGDPAPGS